MKHLALGTSFLLCGTAFGGLDALPPGYGFQEHVFAESADSAPCGRAPNTAAGIARVAFAQTHLMEPSWPLFQLTGGRPALAYVELSGTGAAPDVRLTARIDGKVVGTACLAGPDRIPTTWPDAPDFEHRYTMTLPSAWMRPGLSVLVVAGTDSVHYDEASLGVTSPTDLNLLMFDVDLLHYDDGKPDLVVPPTFLADFAAAMPAAKTRLGRIPARFVLDRFVFGGTDPEPILACRTDLVDRTGCRSYSSVSGMDQLAAVSRLAGAVARATGTSSYGFTYGNSQNFQPGGWGGGKTFVGGDYEGVFLHEMGHALDLPHWGEGSYGDANPGRYDYTYPYGGLNGAASDGGGRGQTWNYEPNTREFVSPLCMDSQNSLHGKERSDAMQRNHWCEETRNTGRGPWDGFGDMSARAIQQFLHGNADSSSGHVPYYGTSPRFHLKKQMGWPNLELDASGRRVLVRGATQPQELRDEENYDFLRPAAWNVPVYTVFGTYHPAYSNETMFLKPAAYVGTLPALVDPTDSATFAALKKNVDGSGPYGGGPYGWYFYWGPNDLTFRFTYADGSTRAALYPYGGVDRNWSTGSGPWRYDLLYFAINIPADKKLAKAELLHRPFVVRYPGDTTTGNIANPSQLVTWKNFLDGATVVATRTFSDVVPPTTSIQARNPTPADIESSGGRVTVFALDGRAIAEFELRLGESLDARARSVAPGRGMLLVRLSSPSGVVSRRVLVP